MTRLNHIALLCTLLILRSDIAHCNEPKVVQLNVLFRHGDRAPETFPKRFPNDPHMHHTFYPMGSGGLLNTGKRRMYQFGQILRNNYSKLLGTEYWHENIYAISSDTPRTKMSLQLVLAALYPPSLSSNRWNDKLDWQPIPIVYKELKDSLLFDGDRCEWYIEELKKVYNSTEIQITFREYETYLKELRLIVGKKSDITLNDILLLHNNLDIEHRMNLTMEAWMLSVLADKRLIQLRQLYYVIGNYNRMLQRLQAGTLMRQITENLQSANKKKTPKVTLFSGHDKNIISLMQLLGVYDLHFPDFGSALLFELLSENQQYYVKILYFRGLPEETTTITLPGCKAICPLDEFVTLTKNLKITDEEMNCKINVDSYFGEDD
ncbi:venom acid phosphatase Acph-1-like isoform X2 [Phymastichus coffea]|nr:venom acid phosphatase Acph-1-like isoform X2 [Phymastichus coffea]XP_058796774.1 venom acid phosphatase Acph-1-like isoform X2 [Phymastichus coffea]